MARPENDELLLEQQILRYHGANATGTTEPRGHREEMHQREHHVSLSRVSVEQVFSVVQCCVRLVAARESAIRDPHAESCETRPRRNATELLILLYLY